jgi:hypothetical protein
VETFISEFLSGRACRGWGPAPAPALRVAAPSLLVLQHLRRVVSEFLFELQLFLCFFQAGFLFFDKLELLLGKHVFLDQLAVEEDDHTGDVVHVLAFLSRQTQLVLARAIPRVTYVFPQLGGAPDDCIGGCLGLTLLIVGLGDLGDVVDGHVLPDAV